MKAVADTLGVARSNLHDKVRRAAKPRGSYRKPEDEDLLPLVRRLVDERPTYGYRRIAALANKELARTGEPAANHKRVFRIMRQNGMLLARHTGRRTGRVHDGKVVVMRSNLRWCSDGFEITCWDGEIVRVAFIIDAHDREIIAWHAVASSGISGSMVRDMMLEAVETASQPCALPTRSSGSPTTAAPTPPGRRGTSPWRSISCLASLPCTARNRTASARASSKRSSATMFASTPCRTPSPRSGRSPDGSRTCMRFSLSSDPERS